MPYGRCMFALMDFAVIRVSTLALITVYLMCLSKFFPPGPYATACMHDPRACLAALERQDAHFYDATSVSRRSAVGVTINGECGVYRVGETYTARGA